MRDSARLVGPKPILLVGRRVTMRLFAHEQQRRDAVAPEAEVEGHAAQHRDDRIDDLCREAGELHDRHRLVVDREPEQAADDFRHRVAADIRALEHEGVARMIAEGLNPRHQAVDRHALGAVLQLAHTLVEQIDQVLDAVGHRRVGGKADVARIASSWPARSARSDCCDIADTPPSRAE